MKPAQSFQGNIRRSLYGLIFSKHVFLIMPYLLFAMNCAYAQEEVSPERSAQGIAYRIGIIIVALIIAWISRGFLLRSMNSLMMKKSKEANATASDPSQGKEVAATNKLSLTEVNVATEMKNTKATREKLVGRAKKEFRNLLYTDLAAILVYGILGIFFFLAEGDPETLAVPAEVKIYAFVGLLYLSLLLVWNIGRYIGYQHQFRAYDHGLFGFVKPIWKLLFWPFQTRWCMMLSVAIMFIAVYGIIFFRSPLLIVALLIHLLLIYRLRTRARKIPNLKLLILRVFLIKKTSAFTFAGLVNFWKHFGSYFTVADPSFYKVNWKKKFNYYFPVYILFIFLIFTQLTDNAAIEDLGGIFGGFVFMLLVGAVIFIVLSNYSIKRKFVSSEALLQKRLEKLDRWPKGYDNTFKEFPVMCYDNTWKQAVDLLVKTSDVILMDLRGFSEANKGCEYEINFLFDHVSAERIVFIAYEDSIPLIRKTIHETWKTQLETSPNLHAKSPGTLLYIVTKEGTKDIQSLIDILLETAVTSEAVDRSEEARLA